MKIHIIQPAIPKYRIPFLKKISKSFNLLLYTTKMDFLNVKTVSEPNLNNLILSKGFFNFFNKLFWHKKLPLFSPYKKNDIVIINGNPRIINYMILFIFLRIRGIKTIWWGHGWSAGSFGFMAMVRIELMRLATVILVYTDKEKEKLSDKYNCYALNNGLDSTEIKECINSVLTINNKSSTLAMRAKKADLFYLIFIGRITKKANFFLLLKALYFANKNIHLNVIGSGEHINDYKLIADELNINNRVHWYGSVFSEIEIAKIMLSSHAFIYTGAVGLSLIHAFNYGLPAIIHSNFKYHMPEYSAFNEGVNGISFKQNNIKDLTKKMNKLSKTNHEKYLTMSSNSFKTVAKSYNVDDMVLRFKKMINNLN